MDISDVRYRRDKKKDFRCQGWKKPTNEERNKGCVIAVREKNRAAAEAERRTKAEEEACRKAKLLEEQMAVVRSEAAREIARIEAETAHKVAKAKAEVRAQLCEQVKAR